MRACVIGRCETCLCIKFMWSVVLLRGGVCVCVCVCVCICQSTFRQRARPPLTRTPTNTHTHTPALLHSGRKRAARSNISMGARGSAYRVQRKKVPRRRSPRRRRNGSGTSPLATTRRPFGIFGTAAIHGHHLNAWHSSRS